METREKIITDFVSAYNEGNVKKLIHHLSADIKYENTSDKNVYMVINGISNIELQFSMAQDIFKYRNITIQTFIHYGVTTEVNINYKSELAIKLEQWRNLGSSADTSGKMLFTFEDDIITEILFFLDEVTSLNNII